ncbi:MAG: hypothetical protein ABI625_18665 [bacterium]
MLRLNLFCSLLTSLGLLAGCSDSAQSPTLPEAKYVRYSGTVNQPAAGGFLVYKMSGAWKFGENNAFISGADTVTILDGKVYGMAGTVTMTFRTRCASISGKDAWAEGEVITSTEPQAFPVGGFGITRLSLASGSPMGGGGPRDVLYPTGSICADRPIQMPAFKLEGGTLTFP